jgi:hypothetical protein
MGIPGTLGCTRAPGMPGHRVSQDPACTRVPMCTWAPGAPGSPTHRVASRSEVAAGCPNPAHGAAEVAVGSRVDPGLGYTTGQNRSSRSALWLPRVIGTQGPRRRAELSCRFRCGVKCRRIHIANANARVLGYPRVRGISGWAYGRISIAALVRTESAHDMICPKSANIKSRFQFPNLDPSQLVPGTPAAHRAARRSEVAAPFPSPALGAAALARAFRLRLQQRLQPRLLRPRRWSTKAPTSIRPDQPFC